MEELSQHPGCAGCELRTARRRGARVPGAEWVGEVDNSKDGDRAYQADERARALQRPKDLRRSAGIPGAARIRARGGAGVHTPFGARVPATGRTVARDGGAPDRDESARTAEAVIAGGRAILAALRLLEGDEPTRTDTGRPAASPEADGV